MRVGCVGDALDAYDEIYGPLGARRVNGGLMRELVMILSLRRG